MGFREGSPYLDRPVGPKARVLMTGPLEEPAPASWAQGRAVSPSPLGAVRGVVSGWRSRATWTTPALDGSLAARVSRHRARASALAVPRSLTITLGANA